MRKIEKAAIIGSGIMGGGIAALCAGAGIKTLLLDIAPLNLTDEEKKDPGARNRIVLAGLNALNSTKPAAFMDREHDLALIETGNLTDDFDRLSECDIIFEVVVENLQIKQDLFARIEKIRKPSAIIASNTSGLPIKKMAEGRSTEFKKHFLIMHFFNPVRYMKLLELIAGEETDREICSFIEKWGEQILGKGIVWGKDTPNFIGNRIGVEMICEAFRLIDNGTGTIPEADAIFGKQMGMPNTAIFGLADLVGNDTIDHLAANSYELLINDEYRGIYKVPEFFTKMIQGKMLGNKTRPTGGFYLSAKDANGKRLKKVLDITKMEHVDYDPKAKYDVVYTAKKMKSTPEKIQHFFNNNSFSKKLLSSMMVYSANRVPEIADSIVDIDNAMKWGYAWEYGPFEMWDSIGLAESLPVMEDAGFTVPGKIKDMLAKGGTTFYRFNNGKKEFWDFSSGSYRAIHYSPQMIFLSNIKNNPQKVVKSNRSSSLIDLGDGVFCFEYHTTMNAINSEIVDLIPEVHSYVQSNGIGLIIGNQAGGIPGAFSAGGDLKYMGELAKSKQFSEIDRFISNVHSGLFGLKYAGFPVVAAPYGLALGGGCECTLIADKIVAHCELYMGLVEIGAGLLPAGGGCTNLWRRVSEASTGSTLDMQTLFLNTFQQIALAKVCTSAMEGRRAGFLRPQDRIIFNRDYLLGEAKKEVIKLVEDGYVPPLKTRIKVAGYYAMGLVDSYLPDMKIAGMVTPHFAHVARTIATVISGGDVMPNTMVPEEYMLKLEREAFVELWKTENTQRMAEHIAATGKPLML